CSGTATVTVTSTSVLAATATATPTNCIANVGTATANPTGGTAPITYAWSTAPPQNSQTATGLGAGTYSVTITDANGCSTTVATTVTAPNGITSVTATSTQASCNGLSDGTATASPTGGTVPYTYLWNNNQTTQMATGLAAVTYSVTVSDANGCTFPATVPVAEPLPILTSFSSVADTCGKKIGSATTTPTGGTPPYTYLWLVNPSQSTQAIAGLYSGIYTCVVTDANGCNVSSSATVANIPGPSANFIANPQVVNILSSNVTFIDLSASNIITWAWSFGDGGNSVVQNPHYTYQSEGTFLVTLIVTNASGCNDTTEQTVIVEGYSTIYVPNTFTPNNDGLNEVFAPQFSRIDEQNYSMMIFDRWGNLVFKTTNVRDYWDGKVHRSGDLVQEDIYVYVITYHDLKKAEHKLIGNVNVVK
ncbi:MAG: gliding motility-associated C-terminal domain-containing protein, partial [Bacteroidetes bacterium]|nr:gliding motility-associated C-terminal domain-containing protein [Bacteroidota bacterium]